MGKESYPSLNLGVVAIEKGDFESPSLYLVKDYGTFLLDDLIIFFLELSC